MTIVLGPKSWFWSRKISINLETQNIPIWPTLAPEINPGADFGSRNAQFCYISSPKRSKSSKFLPAAPELPSPQRPALCRQDLPLGGLINDASWTETVDTESNRFGEFWAAQRRWTVFSFVFLVFPMNLNAKSPKNFACGAKTPRIPDLS